MVLHPSTHPVSSHNTWNDRKDTPATAIPRRPHPTVSRPDPQTQPTLSALSPRACSWDFLLGASRPGPSPPLLLPLPCTPSPCAPYPPFPSCSTLQLQRSALREAHLGLLPAAPALSLLKRGHVVTRPRPLSTQGPAPAWAWRPQPFSQ